MRLRDGLPYIAAWLLHAGRRIVMEDIVLDTSSAGTVFAADKVSTIGLLYEPRDGVRRIRGIGGGAEFVFTKRADRLSVGGCGRMTEIEAGSMSYGFDLDGILEVDFLVRAGAVVDLARMEVRPTP